MLGCSAAEEEENLDSAVTSFYSFTVVTNKNLSEDVVASTVNIDDLTQVSSKTANNFTRNLTYDVTSKTDISVSYSATITSLPLANGDATNFVGTAEGTTTVGDVDAEGEAARFSRPAGITSDAENFYVTDGANNKIRQITIATGVVTTLVGPEDGDQEEGDSDDDDRKARLKKPTDVEVDHDDLYVSDSGNHKIKTKEVSALAGPDAGNQTSGDIDGKGNKARFKTPRGLEISGDGLYVTEYKNHKIRKIE